MMRRLIIVLLIAHPIWAACHVITGTGGGSGITGADWAHACNGFTGNCSGASMVANDSYYLAGGSGNSYHSTSITAPLVTVSASGVTIKAATVADHCITDAGWSNSMAVDGGAGQAVLQADWAEIIDIAADNVTVDGNFPASDTSSTWGNQAHSCSGTQCGIKIDSSIASAFVQAHFQWAIAFEAGHTGVTIRSIEWQGGRPTYDTNSCPGGTGCVFINGWHTVSPFGITNVHITHSYWHDWDGCVGDLISDSGAIIDYNKFYFNFSASGSYHGCIVSFNLNSTNATFRWNWVQDVYGSAAIDILNSGGSNTITNSATYGNFYVLTQGNPNSIPFPFGDGLVDCINTNVCTEMKIYNNTIANWNVGLGSVATVFAGLINQGAGSDATLDNNLVWNSPKAPATPGSGSTSTLNNNWYSTGTTITSGTADQLSSANPFVNSSADTVAGFQLFSDTNTWSSLGSPYNVDMNGVTRTSSRGALQFVSGTAPGASLTPSTLTYPSQLVNITSANQFATLTSTGTAALTVTNITVTSPFVLTVAGSCSGTSFSLAVGNACTIGVTYAPTIVGSQGGTLTVFDNSGGSSTTQTVALSGTAIPLQVLTGTGSVTGSGSIVVHP